MYFIIRNIKPYSYCLVGEPSSMFLQSLDGIIDYFKNDKLQKSEFKNHVERLQCGDKEVIPHWQLWGGENHGRF